MRTALVALLLAIPAQEPRKIKVVTTLAVLGAVAREIAGDAANVSALADPAQDPHYVEPRPTLKQAARDADLFVELGLDLDKWADVVAGESGNVRIQRGQKGRVTASKGVRTLELPEVISKEWGDIHPSGNPHVWLDPLNVRKIAQNLFDGLAGVDEANREAYAKRLREFLERLDGAMFGEALVKEVGAGRLVVRAQNGTLAAYLKENKLEGKKGGWLQKAGPLAGLKVVTYHKTWIYFASRFGLEIAGEVEEKPGIPPTRGHLQKLSASMKAAGVKALLVDIFYPTADAEFAAKESGARVIVTPIDGTDYFALVDGILDRLLEAAK